MCVTEKWVGSYLIDENLCFLTLTEKNLQKRVIFAFLEDIKTSFINYVQSEIGSEFGLLNLLTSRWKTELATTARPYAYARFGCDSAFEWLSDKEIQMKRRLYDQSTSGLDGYNQINENLIDIQNIMRKNIDEVVHRVEKLDRVICSGFCL